MHRVSVLEGSIFLLKPTGLYKNSNKKAACSGAACTGMNEAYVRPAMFFLFP